MQVERVPRKFILSPYRSLLLGLHKRKILTIIDLTPNSDTNAILPIYTFYSKKIYTTVLQLLHVCATELSIFYRLV